MDLNKIRIVEISCFTEGRLNEESFLADVLKVFSIVIKLYF